MNVYTAFHVKGHSAAHHRQVTIAGNMTFEASRYLFISAGGPAAKQMAKIQLQRSVST
jgi:hypothetical protein